MRHPASLAVVAIKRTPTANIGGSYIQGAAIFSVVKCRDWGARFSLEARSFDETHSRAHIIDGIVLRLPRKAMVLSLAPLRPEKAASDTAGSSSPRPPDDMALIERLRSDIETVYLPCSRRELLHVGAAYEIGASSKRTRVPPGSRTGFDAQALWLYFLWTRCRPKERHWLASGWEAWRALERARAMAR